MLDWNTNEQAAPRGMTRRNNNNRVPKGQSLQDPFLNSLRREKVPVSIYLVNGIKLQGVVESFDQFVVLLKNNVSQMVYKHAISTVVPSRNVQNKSTQQSQQQNNDNDIENMDDEFIDDGEQPPMLDE